MCHAQHLYETFVVEAISMFLVHTMSDQSTENSGLLLSQTGQKQNHSFPWEMLVSDGLPGIRTTRIDSGCALQAAPPPTALHGLLICHHSPPPANVFEFVHLFIFKNGHNTYLTWVLEWRKRIEDSVNQFTVNLGCAWHFTSTGCDRGNSSAYMACTMTCGG